MNQPRRLRYHPVVRQLTADVSITVNDLVFPLFIKENAPEKTPIASMPGQYQLSLDDLPAELAELKQLGIKAILLFGIPAQKDDSGSSSWQDNGIVQQAIKICKREAPEILVISDICFCEYTSHGHCGVLDDCQDVDNHATLPLLAQQAVSHAEAGADVIAPSGMMDNMVQVIRDSLDECGFRKIPILSYAVKYASALYGPFRDAAEGAPQFGDRSTYQMNIANKFEALREASIDVGEGADMLMVKPASFYLDIIHQIKTHYPDYPLAAYQVSGEYSMLKAAFAQGWLDPEKAMMESVIALKRAGADIIITYFSKDIARCLLDKTD